jgi:mono/diheme cytochrome c family protein
MRRLLVWSAAFVAVLLVVVFAFVRGMGITTKRDPPAVEEWVANAAWRFLIPRDVRDAANPVPNTPDVLQSGLEHFADHCAMCHANNGSGDTTIGRRIYPPAPDMRGPRTQNLTDGELFYAIEQGIPWTAMPGWGNGTPEGEQESWALVRFIRHLSALTPDELKRMEDLNPRSPAEEARDREIEEFLSGSGSPPVKKGGHRHK